jgi:hypothetical protein
VASSNDLVTTGQSARARRPSRMAPEESSKVAPLSNLGAEMNGDNTKMPPSLTQAIASWLDMLQNVIVESSSEGKMLIL